MTTLGPVTDPTTYEWAVCDLLHDQFVRWTQPQIDTYINAARAKMVKDTGCLRTLQTAYLTQAREQYVFGQVTGCSIVAGGSGYSAPTVTFAGGGGVGAAATLAVTNGAITAINFSSYGANYTSAPIPTIVGAGSGAQLQVGVISVLTYDILAISNFWGTQRYGLEWAPFRLFSARFRPFLSSAYQQQPGFWSAYGDNSFFIAPTPDQTYMVEVDSVILPTPFAVGDTTTIDTIPVLRQDPVSYYAAYLAKLNSRNFGEAQSFLEQYRVKTQENQATYVGRIPDVYQSG
jgi:hypothetical protein